MGYYVQQIDQQFFIAKNDCKKALTAIKKLAQHADKMSGGSSNGERWFSWVTTSDFVNAKSLEEALSAWRWLAEQDKDGNIAYLYFEGDKLGDEETLFDAIAPYVKDGSYLEMSGEDGARWRWGFEDGKCKEREAHIDFEPSIPKVIIHVEGGNVTGVMSNQNIKVEIFDVDNLKVEGSSVKDIDKEWEKVTKGMEEVL